ncbi:sigma 54-interacting transcriptional regulator [Victivallis sp. Marseille-Q1083]|uniref:sigma 54-interacting transcriptional regulator n=1 Tax=Victivallis sp. Marseille-Q1083 TaxID=2717288 RepID=UPI0015886BD2|nr:sigma 54-interacting transcriptional regulator [Victivallis sp. Marseille-Q1083]
MVPTRARNQHTAVAVLNQISHVLVHHKDVSKLLKEVLDILYREMGLQRGTLTMRQGDILSIEASHGLSEAEMKRGIYHLGEGITGRVAQTGKPQIIPDISREPEFLDRTQARADARHTAFICVPIIHEEEVIGTLSIDREKAVGVDLEQDCNLLETVANIMADAVSVSFREHEEREKLLEENRRLKQELHKGLRPDNIIGNCNAMRNVYAMIHQVAKSNATVMIRGSSGTGKELVARAIQSASNRRDRPFVVVNCAALPENLIESELFGHEKGAFTGAVSRRTGRVEAADGGTIFLDEIGDLSQPMQVKLLRFIQERTFQRVGSNEERKVDVRILAATSRDLEALMGRGEFREDLYYRLNVFPIHLPDLQNRRSDIVLLADYFLDKYNKIHGKAIKRISTPAINMMMAYHWPGNVRELENCMERAVLTADHDVIHGYHLPPSLQTGQATGTAKLSTGSNADFQTMVASFERELIVEALKLRHGNVAAAARHLGTTPRILHYKIRKLGVTPEWYH